MLFLHCSLPLRLLADLEEDRAREVGRGRLVAEQAFGLKTVRLSGREGEGEEAEREENTFRLEAVQLGRQGEEADR